MERYDISFDQFQRYETVRKLIEYHRQDPKIQFRILEIGSNEHKDLALFMPCDEIIFSDVVLTLEMQKDPQFMEIDGNQIPFGDNAFDFVVALDVLEHIPENKRENFLMELNRVSSKGTIISFPYKDEWVEAAEQRVNTFYKILSGEDFIWLKEHIENGLPDIMQIENLFKNRGLKFFSLYHGTLDLWESLWHCHFRTVFSREMLEYRKHIDYLYNKTIYQTDIGEQCYRAFMVSSKCDLQLWKEFADQLWVKKETKVSVSFQKFIDHFNELNIYELLRKNENISNSVGQFVEQKLQIADILNQKIEVLHQNITTFLQQYSDMSDVMKQRLEKKYKKAYEKVIYCLKER